MHCAKDDFPHDQYAFYLHAIDTRRAVKCGMAAVMWCDVMATHRCAAHSIPHFTFRIPHAAVPHFTHSLRMLLLVKIRILPTHTISVRLPAGTAGMVQVLYLHRRDGLT